MSLSDMACDRTTSWFARVANRVEQPSIHVKPERSCTRRRFTRTNSAELVGKTAVYRGNPTPCSFASYLIRLRLLPGCVAQFLAYYINSFFGRAWIKSVVSQQVGQANVNGTKLQDLVLPLPPLAEQERIVGEVERRLSVIEELDAAVTANLKRAERLRQSILHRAFTGALVGADIG